MPTLTALNSDNSPFNSFAIADWIITNLHHSLHGSTASPRQFHALALVEGNTNHQFVQLPIDDTQRLHGKWQTITFNRDERKATTSTRTLLLTTKEIDEFIVRKFTLFHSCAKAELSGMAPLFLLAYYVLWLVHHFPTCGDLISWSELYPLHHRVYSMDTRIGSVKARRKLFPHCFLARKRFILFIIISLLTLQSTN